MAVFEGKASCMALDFPQGHDAVFMMWIPDGPTILEFPAHQKSNSCFTISSKMVVSKCNHMKYIIFTFSMGNVLVSQFLIEAIHSINVTAY